MASTLALYRRVTRLPFGDRLFSIAFGRRSPYFRTIKPQVRDVAPHRAVVGLAKRKAVHNHIGTVHAIAACNGLEAAMGLLAEATTPADLRWLPKGMEVSYLAKATGDLTCYAATTEADWAGAPDVPVAVHAALEDGTRVVEGIIHLWVTPRK